MPPVASLSLGTAIGLGILCAVGSVAMGQRLWLRAQKRFWKDWTRLTQMLKGDLQVSHPASSDHAESNTLQTRFSTGVETQVLAKPLAAADGLEKLIAKRDRRLDDLQTRVDGLRSRLYPAQ